jgi:F-type H+-transporting ATPase subunit a
MGEHSTWFDFLNAWKPFREHVYQTAQHNFERTWTLGPFADTHFTLAHVFGMILVGLLLTFGAFAYRGAVMRGGKDAAIPPPRFNVRNFFEMFAEGVFALGEGVMGRKNTIRYLPLLGSLAFVIFCSNALALVPGFTPPTDTLKTNLALSSMVFLATHYYGVKEHGLAYFKHFLGPIPWLAPLMLPIELISHIARPISLALRLMGNMAADHKVVGIFFTLIPLLVPVPFLVLGMLVVVVQTLVFTLLSMVYISMAVAHEEH